LSAFGFLEGGDLSLNQQDAILRHLGFEGLQTQFHRRQVVPLPYAAHPGRRDR